MYFVYIPFQKSAIVIMLVIARIIRHNAGMVKATKNCQPYILCKSKGFETEQEARKEELRIKKQKSRIYIESLITGNW